jgi:nucleotide-binding universal stress UspA family protein
LANTKQEDEMTVKSIHRPKPSPIMPANHIGRTDVGLPAHPVRVDSGKAKTGPSIRRLRFKSVIVPLDGSRYAEHALPLALNVASAAKAPIVLESSDSLFGHSFDYWSLSFEEASSPRRKDRTHKYLKGFAQQISTEFVPVSARLRETPISAQSLFDTSSESDLVVMAQRPRRLADPFHLGHSVERILRFSSSPLIYMRGYKWPYSLRKARQAKHVLVVLDGTAETEHALPAATAIAEATAGQLSLLQVVPGMPYYGIPWAEKEIEAAAYLDTVAHALQRRRLTVEKSVWSSNESLDEVILSFAQNCNADLIALTTSLRRTLVGSFRRQPVRNLVRNSTLPLLLVSSDKAKASDDQLARLKEAP